MRRSSHLMELCCPGNIDIPTSTLNAHSVTLTQAGTADDASQDQAIGMLSGQANAQGTAMIMQATGDHCSIVTADDALHHILCHITLCATSCSFALHSCLQAPHRFRPDTVHQLLDYTAVSVAYLRLAVWPCCVVCCVNTHRQCTWRYKCR